MRLRFTRRLRLAVSKWYLDLAERMPERTKGRIAELQSVRKRQRDQAANYGEKARVHTTQGLAPFSIYLVEIFPIENLEAVRDGLARLFPSIEADSPLENFHEDFGRDTLDFEVAFYRVVGRIVRPRRWFLNPGSTRTVPEMPAEIEYIEVGVSKILPSAVIILLDVKLSADANARFLDAAAKEVLSRVVFTNLLPWSSKLRLAETSVTEEMRVELLGWFLQLRNSVEGMIRPYLSGYFANSSREKVRLPALEVFAQAGVSAVPETFEGWLKSSYPWRRTVGLDFERGYFISEHAVYVADFSRRTQEEPVDRLVLLGDSWSHSSGESASAQAPDDRARQMLAGEIPSLVDFIALRSFLDASTTSIGELRYRLYRSMASETRFARYISNYADVLKRLGLLERLWTDFKDLKPWMVAKLSNFQNFVFQTRFQPEQSGPPLGGWLVEELEATFERNSRYVKQLSDAYSNFLNLQNMRANFALQSWVALLTLVALYATILGVWGWQNVQTWFYSLDVLQQVLAATVVAVPMAVTAWDNVSRLLVSAWHFLVTPP